MRQLGSFALFEHKWCRLLQVITWTTTFVCSFVCFLFLFRSHQVFSYCIDRRGRRRRRCRRGRWFVATLCCHRCMNEVSPIGAVCKVRQRQYVWSTCMCTEMCLLPIDRISHLFTITIFLTSSSFFLLFYFIFISNIYSMVQPGEAVGKCDANGILHFPSHASSSPSTSPSSS